MKGGEKEGASLEVRLAVSALIEYLHTTESSQKTDLHVLQPSVKQTTDR